MQWLPQGTQSDVTQRVRGWRRALLLTLTGGLSLAWVSFPAHAQRTHVLVVSGLSGQPAFHARFETAIRATHDAARTRWGVSDSSVIVLTEDAAPAPVASGKSTRENIAQAFARLSSRVQPGDVLLVLLLGHGSGNGAGSRVNIPGPDATAVDYRSWIAGFARQQVVFVNAASGSGDFVAALQGPGRVIVTATRSAGEKNESVFAGHFTTALGSDAADADKDGRISVLEAFRYARTEVAKVYETTNRLQTEHAVMSDSVRAATVSFGADGKVQTPRVAALLAERQALESQVAALRGRKSTMSEAAYDTELERLLIAIAEKSQAIRAGGGAR